jgi:hypothetical protein
MNTQHTLAEPALVLTDTTNDGMLNLKITTDWKNLFYSLFYFMGATNIVFFLLVVFTGPGMWIDIKLSTFEWGYSTGVRHTIMLVGGGIFGIAVPAWLCGWINSRGIDQDNLVTRMISCFYGFLLGFGAMSLALGIMLLTLVLAGDPLSMWEKIMLFFGGSGIALSINPIITVAVVVMSSFAHKALTE